MSGFLLSTSIKRQDNQAAVNQGFIVLQKNKDGRRKLLGLMITSASSLRREFVASFLCSALLEINNEIVSQSKMSATKNKGQSECVAKETPIRKREKKMILEE